MAQALALALLISLAGQVANASGGPGDGGGGGADSVQQAAERADRDAARAEERATRDAADAQDRASRAETVAADRTARIEQRFVEDQAKAAADVTRDPVKATQDLAKAEAERQAALTDVASDTMSSNSGSGSSGSGSSGSGSGDSGGGSGSSGSSGSSGDDGSGGSSSSMRELASEENPEFDPRGFPVRRGEVVALDLGEAGLAQARAEGFQLIARDEMQALSGTITRLGLPRGVAAETGLARLRTIDRGAVFDLTHYYGLQFTPQGAAEGGRATLLRRPGKLTIGMIDTAVGPHPTLSATKLTQRHFGTGAAGAGQTVHGTAVASILASEGSSRLLVADVFRGSAEAPFTSADAIAQSLEWLAENHIRVVNISLAGPRNAILDRLIERASARGMVVVAAAGNGGPMAPPAYPAALRTVVAVTAVDEQSSIYRYANQGDYIAVAARGVSEPAAAAGGGVTRYSGTSFATPHISAWFARCLGNERDQNAAATARCRARMQTAARDAGKPGHDPVYGWGIIDRQ